MTSITFHGGVNDIGGNKFLVEDNGTKIFMDFGMSFSQEGMYFAEFLHERTSNSLIDMFELGLLPKLKGLYRTDYAKHMNFDGHEETEIDAVLLTHAHVDHCAYISYLRPDIPIYCTEESKQIMQSFDKTGSGDQYVTLKERFQVRTNKKGEVSRCTGDDVAVPRDIRTFSDGKNFNIDSIEVEPLAVDHSIPGVSAFILHTSTGSIANTADLRFHGRRSKDTEKFVEKCGESSLDLMLCEGTRVEKTSSLTEYDVENEVTKIIENTKELVMCTYPVRDLDRFTSFYLAAKKTGRNLVIDLKQALILDLFNSSSVLQGKYPKSTDPQIKIYMPKGSWGLIDKDLAIFSEKQLRQDYDTWKRDFLDYPNAIDYRDVSKHQNELIFYCNDFHLQDLIDVKPSEGSSVIRSSTEPFSIEMEFDLKRVQNWYKHFGLSSSEKDWHQIHVSGHGDGQQIKQIIDGANAKTLIPIHTQHDEYHKKWHSNVHTVKQHEEYSI